MLMVSPQWAVPINQNITLLPPAWNWTCTQLGYNASVSGVADVRHLNKNVINKTTLHSANQLLSMFDDWRSASLCACDRKGLLRGVQLQMFIAWSSSSSVLSLKGGDGTSFTDWSNSFWVWKQFSFASPETLLWSPSFRILFRPKFLCRLSWLCELELCL